MGVTGERIKALRLQKGMTQEDVAKMLHIGKQAIYKYENGTVTNIPLANVEILAKIFDVPPQYICGWEEKSLELHYTDEKYLINTYRSLTDKGKELLQDRAQELRILYGCAEQDASSK